MQTDEDGFEIVHRQESWRGVENMRTETNGDGHNIEAGSLSSKAGIIIVRTPLYRSGSSSDPSVPNHRVFTTSLS